MLLIKINGELINKYKMKKIITMLVCTLMCTTLAIAGSTDKNEAKMAKLIANYDKLLEGWDSSETGLAEPDALILSTTAMLDRMRELIASERNSRVTINTEKTIPRLVNSKGKDVNPSEFIKSNKKLAASAQAVSETAQAQLIIAQALVKSMTNPKTMIKMAATFKRVKSCLSATKSTVEYAQVITEVIKDRAQTLAEFQNVVKK